MLISSTWQRCNLQLVQHGNTVEMLDVATCLESRFRQSSVAPAVARCFLNSRLNSCVSCLTRLARVHCELTGSVAFRHEFGSMAGNQVRPWPHGEERLQACPTANGECVRTYIHTHARSGNMLSVVYLMACARACWELHCISCLCTSRTSRHLPLWRRRGATVVHPD